MKNQITIPLLTALALATTIAGAEPVYKFGDNANLHVLADVALVYEDNIFLAPDSLKEEDIQLVFSPGVELVMKNGTASATTLRYQHTFVRYDDHSEMNEELADVSFSTRYDSGVTLFRAHAKYKEEYSNTYGIDTGSDIFGVLVMREITQVGGNMKYGLTDLTAISGGVDYMRVNYKDPTYSDQDSLTVPVTVFYKVRPNIDLTGGIRYRNTDTSKGLEYEDMYYFVGAVGEVFSPVVYADLNIGYQERTTKNSSLPDKGSASYSLSFIYTGNPKSTAYFTAARDYRTSAYNALSYSFTSGTLGASYSLSSMFGINGSIAYGTAEYEQSPREEDVAIIRLGANYSPNDYLTISASYYYRDVDGNVADYTDNEFRVTASLRY